jgi:hypothetical protein
MSQDPRAAAEALKAAIDRHLAASADKSGEEDPKVQQAYEALREAAETYDDVLFDAYDEVTPFEFSRGPIYETAEVADERMPSRVSVFQRRDFAVRSADDLLAAGAAVLRDEGAEDEVGDLTPAGALALHLDLRGLDATTEAADDLGLHWLGGTMWVVDQDVEDDSLTNAPFAVVDESRLLHRLDEDVIG